MILFNDALSLGSVRPDSPMKRRMSIVDHTQIGDAFKSGGSVNIFDLTEVMLKAKSTNPLVATLVEKLKPSTFLDDDITSMDSDQSTQLLFLELAQMKLTARLAKFGFDYKYLLEIIDYKHKGRIRLHKLVHVL